jgi:stress response protein YsnF
MVQQAINCCSRLNQWALAVDLAREHNVQADNLLYNRAMQLQASSRKVDEVNLYKKAQQHHKSAQVLVDVAKDAVVSLEPKLRSDKMAVWHGADSASQAHSLATKREADSSGMFCRP